MLAFVKIMPDDIGVLMCCVSTSEFRGSDEYPEHLYEIVELLVPEASYSGNKCWFEGSTEALEEALRIAIGAEAWFFCQGAGEWEQRQIMPSQGL